MDFSWIRCIENLYGSYTKEKNVRANTLAALRNEVSFFHLFFNGSKKKLISSNHVGLQIQSNAASAGDPRKGVRQVREDVQEACGGSRREAVRADLG